MKLIRVIARGGFGEVSEIELASGERVAQKTFSPHPNLGLVDTEKLKKRFRREVSIQKQLAKYGAVPVLDSDLDASPPWFTMPLADRNYRDQIAEDQKSGTITGEAIAEILTCLEEVHQRGVIHRDLKPENILRIDGRWCLADFGLSIQPEGGTTTKLTTTGSAYGSANYTSPEQLKEFSKVRASADVYSFGCILHDLIDGGYRAPYGVASTKGKWDGLLRKCTASDPEKRFKSISVLRELLDDTIRKHGILKPRAEVVAWQAELSSIDSWEPEKFLELARAVENEKPGDELGVLAELTAVHFEAIQKGDGECWLRVAQAFANWLHAGFTWSFCDVLADRAASLFAATDDKELQASLAVGLANMATRNHRFFAMKKLVGICGPRLDPDTAERIAIEFRAEENPDLMASCLRDLWHYSKSDLHPTLAELVEE